MRFVRSLSLVAFLSVAVVACDRNPASLPADQRPVTSQLPSAERFKFRHLPVEGAPNFRDLGGYRTADGLSVKWGMLYRTDALNELTDGDEAYLERLNIQRIVDFRGPLEVKDAPDRLPAPLAARYVSMPMPVAELKGDRKFVERLMRGDTADMKLNDMLVDINRQFVRDFTPVFREWLHGLANAPEGAQVIHCTSGKDRTGFAAAVFLLSLGVPMDTVMQDYLASNDYLRDKNERSVLKLKVFSLFRADTDGIRFIMGVEKRYLQAAFDTINADYGSIDNYLVKGLGVDPAFREKLRERYLDGMRSS
ncbi:hypothetical protein B9N43_16280 [Denitratisoma sp. DHT3]|uniref:tyrosine-protein phosphatase n=1 Tax=Denitratisoma sp. DHT3 TaxID=1981880 RepID=UPI0011988668|nr:tyrosine-protein phosphatase [Denitratisoma sp. DHT3]QDX82652.1 hypothetical protein B9N43_16280 [Denitratisoma sp. DHT3]